MKTKLIAILSTVLMMFALNTNALSPEMRTQSEIIASAAYCEYHGETMVAAMYLYQLEKTKDEAMQYKDAFADERRGVADIFEESVNTVYSKNWNIAGSDKQKRRQATSFGEKAMEKCQMRMYFEMMMGVE